MSLVGEQLQADNQNVLLPLDQINGYNVRPGLYEINGATAIPGGVSFTVYSCEAYS